MAGGAIPAPCMLVYCQIPPPALGGYSILSILVFEYRVIYLHMGPIFSVLSPTSGMLGSL